MGKLMFDMKTFQLVRKCNDGEHKMNEYYHKFCNNYHKFMLKIKQWIIIDNGFVHMYIMYKVLGTFHSH